MLGLVSSLRGRLGNRSPALKICVDQLLPAGFVSFESLYKLTRASLMLKSEFRSATFKQRNSSMTDLQRSKPNHTTITIQNGGNNKEDSENRKELVVLGIALDSLPKAVQFFICCGGVFLFYLIYGYVQVKGSVKAKDRELWNPILQFVLFFWFYLFIAIYHKIGDTWH